MKNKFILRRHTAVTAALEQNDPASWTMERGLGVLSRVAISEICDMGARCFMRESWPKAFLMPHL